MSNSRNDPYKNRTSLRDKEDAPSSPIDKIKERLAKVSQLYEQLTQRHEAINNAAFPSDPALSSELKKRKNELVKYYTADEKIGLHLTLAEDILAKERKLTEELQLSRKELNELQAKLNPNDNKSNEQVRLMSKIEGFTQRAEQAEKELAQNLERGKELKVSSYEDLQKTQAYLSDSKKDIADRVKQASEKIDVTQLRADALQKVEKEILVVDSTMRDLSKELSDFNKESRIPSPTPPSSGAPEATSRPSSPEPISAATSPAPSQAPSPASSTVSTPANSPPSSPISDADQAPVFRRR